VLGVVVHPQWFPKQEREENMLNELSQQLKAKGYWFNIQPDNTFILNTFYPQDAPATNDLEPELGIIMTVQVLPSCLQVRWARECVKFDKTWNFSSVAQFMGFFESFLTFRVVMAGASG
jgi:hypothetical protein